MNTARRSILMIFCLMTLSIGGISAWGADQKSVAASAPQADDILQSYCRFYGRKTSFSVDFSKETLMRLASVKNVRTETLQLALRRPNQISIALKKGYLDGSIYCDGKILTSYFPTYHQYTQEQAPETFDLLFTQRKDIAGQMLYTMPLIQALITADNYEILKSELYETEYLGSEKIDQLDCHKLRIRTYPFEVLLFIQQGDEPLLRRITSHLSDYEQDPRSRGDEIKLTWDFSNWRFDVDLPVQQFAFAPPAGAKKVDAFWLPETKAGHPLVGKKGTDFSLSLLGGGKATLSEHFDKKIVILEFWASWCGPCVAGLPVLDKVSRQFQDKDVIMYAINQQEYEGQVKAFLEKRQLDLKVPLDTSGQVGNQYGVRGIPQTVIIDKQGVIRHVHTGLLPNMEEQLARELTQLIEGEAQEKTHFDLACKSVLSLPEKLQVGDQVALKFVAGNLGPDSIASGTHNIRLSIANEIAYMGPADVAIASQGDATFLIPQDIWHLEFTKEGLYDYQLEIDSDGHISETNEKNNVCLGRVEVVAVN